MILTAKSGGGRPILRSERSVIFLSKQQPRGKDKTARLLNASDSMIK